MTPNSSSGAGVAVRPYSEAGNPGGEWVGHAAAMVPVGLGWNGLRGRWAQGSGLWAGRSQICEHSQRLQSGGACPEEQMEGNRHIFEGWERE